MNANGFMHARRWDALLDCDRRTATTGKPDTIDIDEVITAIAKTVAELTCSQDGTIRQQLIERLMREIMNYDAEFRQDDRTGAIGSAARH
jgi:hypothetical protein